MTRRRAFLHSATTLLALTVAMPVTAQAVQPPKVVATFSILGDMVQRIGGNHVHLTTLVGPNGDPHVFQPTPADARTVSEADVLIVNGLEFEGWLDRLIDASDFKGSRVVATTGIEPIAFAEGEAPHEDGHHDGEEHHDDDKHHGEGEHHDDEHAADRHGDESHAHDDDHHGHHHGAFDPHSWQSLDNAVKYVDNITAALAQANPANANAYYANRTEYVAEISKLDGEIRKIIMELPDNRRTVITSHDAFQYFGRDYGLTFLAPQGLSTDSEASAQSAARLIEHIKNEGISAVFVENIADARLLKQIASETGASIGGTLYPGALSGPDGPAPTYLELMRHNATSLAKALMP